MVESQKSEGQTAKKEVYDYLGVENDSEILGQFKDCKLLP